MKALFAVCGVLSAALVAIVTLTPPRSESVHVIVECPKSIPRDDCQVILDAALVEAKRVRARHTERTVP